MRKSSILIASIVALLIAPGVAGASTEEKLQAVLDELVAEHLLLPGASAYVSAPRAGLPWSGAAGQFSEGSSQPLSPKDPFRIASVQKPFTAAAILRLVEEGRLELDQPVAPFLEADQVDRMHVYKGVNYGHQVTIHQLLRHTSGLNSHDECNEYMAAIATGPNRRWTPHEQIETMIDCGDPVFAPDTSGMWHYSDTGYVMLGKVLSGVTGKSYAGALRELLPLEKIGLDHTWHELLEPGRADPRPRAHQYFGPADLTGWDPSFDSWGGGGYVSTVEDLVTFIRALFEGRIFEKRSTLRLMKLSVPTGSSSVPRYASGLQVYRFGETRCMGHSGFWSTALLYCPPLDLALAGTTNQANDEHMEPTQRYLREGIVAVVKEARELKPVLSVHPRTLDASRRSRVEITFSAGEHPLSGASVRIGTRRAYTNASGSVRMRIGFRRPGVRTIRACKPGVGCETAKLRVRSG